MEEIKTEPMRVQKPGYFIESPVFPSVNELKDILGLRDSTIQTNEIALQYFEEIGNAKEEGINNFLKQMGDKYKISHGTNKFSFLKSTIHGSYIVQTYNIAESFFKSLIREYRYYKNISGDSWKTKNENGETIDVFNQLLYNLPNASRALVEEKPEYKLLDYYRLVRNANVHLHIDRDKINGYYNKYVVPNKQYFQSNYSGIQNAPNSIYDINFEDFQLYTRALKYFSNHINNACDLQISEIAQKAAEDKDLQNYMRKFHLLPQKRRMKLIGYYRGKHRMTAESMKHSKQFADYFIKHYCNDSTSSKKKRGK